MGYSPRGHKESNTTDSLFTLDIKSKKKIYFHLSGNIGENLIFFQPVNKRNTDIIFRALKNKKYSRFAKVSESTLHLKSVTSMIQKLFCKQTRG